MFRLSKAIQCGFSNEVTTGAIFLNVTNEFDGIWHEGLKIVRLDVDSSMMHLVVSYLAGLSFCIQV